MSSVKVSIKTDVTRLMGSIKEFPKAGQRAMVSALNKTLAMANTASKKELQTIYSLKPSDFTSKKGAKVVVNKATTSRLFSSLYIRGTRMGLYLFAPKSVKAYVKETKSVVSRLTVEVKRGHRVLMNRRAFIAPWTRHSPNLWIMEADKSKGKTAERLSNATGRPYKAYPRKALFTISLPEMYRSRRVAKVIFDTSKNNFERIFKHEFLARIKGFVKVKKAA